ncbi:MAG: ATP-binding protein [Bacteroidota bacterium]
MKHPEIPANEAERLSELYSYDLLDTVPEQAYDDIVAIAAGICGTPVSLISLVDKDRCWFKAKVGLEQTEAPRQIAYAAHAINSPHEPTVIEDALADERFCDCPLVLANPPMRFYVGTPLVTDTGHVLGTLCVIDHQPRKLNDGQIQILKRLAKQVVAQFDLRKKVNEVNLLNKQLQDAYQEMEAFSYSVSHDLKAPLRNIKGFSELLLEAFVEQLDEDGQVLFQSIIQSTHKMENIIKDIMDLSKINRSELSTEQIDITQICTSIIDEIPHRDRYVVKITPKIFAEGDKKLMSTLWRNLISNAFKYSSKVNNPVIEIGQQPFHGTTLFYIKDNGTGFDMTTASNIFQPFQRLHGDSEFEGNGIGLAIVKRIVQRHKGKIWAESELGKGATFYFTLT